MLSILLLLSVLFQVQSLPPSLETKISSIKTDLSVLGDKFSVGLYELEFDQDLYVPIGIGYCPDVTCSRVVNASCPPCDYRDCKAVNAGRPAGCDQCPDANCDAANQVPVLEINGDPLTFKINPNNGYTFLIYTVAKDPCTSILIKWNNTNGVTNSLLAYRLLDSNEPVISPTVSSYPRAVSITRNSMLICPNSELSGDTILLAFSELNTFPYADFQFTISAETIPLPQPKIKSTCTVPDAYVGIVNGCLVEGATLVANANAEQRFYLQLDKRCGTLQFTSNIFNLLISKNPWVSPTNSSGSSKTASFYQTTDWIFPGEPGVLYYCLEAGEDLFAWVELKEAWNVSMDSSEDWLINTPLTAISPFDTARFTLGAVTIECEDKDFTAWKYSPSYIEPIDGGSANLRVIYPSEEPKPFSSATYFVNYEWLVASNPDLTGPAVPKKLNIALTLTQNLVPRLQPVFPTKFPHDYEFLPIDQFPSCKVKLNGLLRNKGNEPLLMTISDFTPKQMICSASEFAKINQLMDKFIDSSLDLVQDDTPTNNNLDHLLYNRFSADVLTTSDAFYFCKREIESYVNLTETISQIESTRCLSQFGTSNFSSDPCCSSPDDSYDGCILENRTYSSYTVDPESDFSIVELNCPSPVCANEGLVRYFIEKERIKQSCADPPQSAEWTKDSIRFYYTCYTQIFGHNAKAPTPCVHDDDCPSGVLCNSQTKNCMGNVTQLEQKFLECIIDSATLFGLIGVSRQLGVPYVDDPVALFDSWWPLLQTHFECSAAANDVPSGLQQVLYGSGIPPTCQYCNSVEMNPTSVSPSTGVISVLFHWDCFARSQPCDGGSALIPGVAECFGSITCNYDRDLDPFGGDYSPCSKTGNFCGFSENERDATDVTVGVGAPFISLADCPTSIVCILANGTRILAASDAECTQTMSCDLCADCTEAECPSEGSCSDANDPIYSIFSGSIFGNASITGGCLTQIRYKDPWVDTTDVCVFPLRSTVFGCMIFPPYVDEASCTDPNELFGFSSTMVSKLPSYWVPRSTNQTQCEAVKACRGVARPSLVETFYSDVVVVPENSTCKGNGNYQNLWTWTSAKWRGGQIRRPSIMEYGSKFTYSGPARNGTDITRILALFEITTDQELALLVGSSLLCEHNLQTQILESLVCSCSNHSNESTCFKKEVNRTTEKIGIVCGGKATTISSPPVWIILNNGSSDSGSCLSIPISNLHISTYAPRPSGLLTLLLIQSSFDYSYAIENPNGATFGKIITDGFSMFDNNPNNLTNIRICIAKLQELDDRLPVLDLARLTTNSGQFEPLYLFVRDFGDRWCANMDEVTTDDEAYFFIQRTEGDWMNPPNVGFTSGERAYMIVILALYCLGAVIITGVLIRHIIVNFDLDRMLFVIIVMEAFFICRIVLFSLALSNIASTQRDPAAGYLLVEFPILLFFCFVSFFVISWGLILWSQNDVFLSKRKFLRLVNFAVILFNAVIFGLFILMIILFQTVVEDPYYICADTQIVTDASESRALSLSYRIIFSTVAIILGMALLVVGGFMFRMISDKDLQVGLQTLVQVLVATFVGTFGLLAQAIYYLVVVAVGNKQSINLTLSILLVDEVIPALIFTTLAIVTTPGRKGLSGFLTKMKATSKGSGKSGGSTQKGSTKTQTKN